MKKQTGIWIDTKKAIVVSLSRDQAKVTEIESEIKGRIRIPGEGKWYSRFGRQFFNFEKRQQRKKDMKVETYLLKIIRTIKEAEEVVLFGPGQMKKKLDKQIEQDPSLNALIRHVVPCDNLTDNQVVAWVRKYYHS